MNALNTIISAHLYLSVWHRSRVDDGVTTTSVRREHHGQGVVGSNDYAGCVRDRQAGGSFQDNASCFSRNTLPPQDALVLWTRKTGMFITCSPV